MPVPGALSDIPSNWKLPLFWLTVDGSQAGLATQREPAMLTGQMFGGQFTSAPKTAGNTGNGTLAMDIFSPVLPGAVSGVYKAVFTSPTSFTVKDPNNNTVGAGIVGSAFAGPVKFMITAGTTPFAISDEFDVTVTRVPVGNGPYNTTIAIGSPASAAALFGFGSMLHRMAVQFFALAPEHELWMMAVPDPAAGVAATGAITIATAATTAGTVPFYIAGQNVDVLANGTDTTAQIAAKVVAAINAAPMLPVTAAVDGVVPNKVDLTCKWLGSTGNDIVLLDCYYGAIGGEQLPAGLSLVYTPFSGGTGAPDYTAAIPALGDDEYDYVGLPYTDSVTLALWEIEFGFTASGRWGWERQIYGGIFSARRDTYANLMTFGPTRNSPNVSIKPLEPMSPMPVWEETAGYAALAADALLDDPARPLQTLEFTGFLPPRREDRFAQNQKQALATVGLAICGVAPSGNPAIQREQTTYQLNSYGQSDDAYELVTTLFTLARLFRRMKSAITSKYPRQKLADDGTSFGTGQPIITPSIAKAELLAEYQGGVTDGLVENYTAFKSALQVFRDPDIPTRLNVVYPPQIVSGLRIFAVLAQFRLKFGRGAS